MGTPSGSSKQPPIAPRAHLQSLISSPQAAPPTGPRNLGYSTNESFSVNNQDFSASRNSQTSTITPLPTLFTTLPPRVRPRHWRTLCRNTVPYDQPYPPPSSQTTIPNLCGRGDSCHYGHHGDVYLDAVELGTLSFEHGIPHALGVDINSYDMGSSWSDHHVSLSVETNERRDSNVRQGLGCEPGANESFHSGQGVEAWMEKRAEWRRRQAVLGPHADSTYTQPKWEDRYKNKDAKNRRNDTGRHPIENKRSPVGGIDENGWGEYTARRQRAQVNTKERQWQWELETATTTNRQETQDSTQFEQSLKQLSLNYPGGLPPGAACRRGANNPQGIEEAEEDQGESTSSGETASTVQFIITPFQKGLKPFQNTPAHSPMKPNVVAVPYSLSHTVSLANFSFDPSAVAFSPTPSSNMQGLRTFRGEGPPAPVLTRQPSRELIFSPKALPPPQPAPGHSQSFSVPHNDYGQRLARCDSRPLQKPHRTGNTFIVQSHPSTAHSRIQTTPPLRPQLHLNHTLNQMTMLLSLYPDCSNKVQTTEVLTKLIVPDTPEDMNRSPSYISESLQTALHRLALSISQQENEIVAQFQAEMWGVLAWLGANGGSVALLTESEDKGRMVDKQSVERVLDVCGNVEADANARGAGIMLASGQITLHGTDEHDEGYSEVVALTPGQPAILSPVLPSASQAPASDWHLPTMIVNGSPILSAKSNGNKEGSEYHGQVRQPLPPTSAEEILVPLSSSSANHPLPTQANEQYTLETISFFLSNKMESYLQDSYDKVVRVQTAISLKWRRVSKVFEREWCSGISRYARNGIVLRAFWNVHAMEETDWLAMEDSFAHSGIPHTWEQVWGQSTNRSASTGSGSTEKPISVEGNRGAEHKPVSKNSWDSYSPTLSQEFRYWDKQPTGATRAGQEIPHEDSNAKRNGKEGHQDTWETRCRMPQRAVWDRRGLCQEVEPVALSNEGRHFLELIEKMCLKQVMDFADIDIGGKSSEYILKLPPPPAVRLFRKSEFKDDGDNIHPATVGNEDWSVPLGSKNGNYSRQFEGSSSDDWSHYKPVESGQASRSQGKEDYNDNSQSRGRRRERGGPNTSTRSSTVPGLCLEDEYNIEFDSSEEFLLPLLIHSLKLEPRLIESPVLNPIFRRSGPLYYTGNTSIGEEVFGAEESKIDAKVRAKHLEMCHLDRSLFMGYIVLEILNVWEEQRKHAARVRWKFPELDRKALVGERVKILAEKNLRLAKERKERQERVVQETAPAPAAPPPPPAPNWADVARGKGKVEEKKAPPATQTPVLKTPVKEKQAEAQLLTGKLNVKEKQPPTVGAQVSVVKTLMAAPPNQPDSTPKTLKQAESTTSQKYVPGPQPVEIPKARLPGSGLLYTDILKKSAALNQGQPILHPSPAPPLPAHVAVKATADTEEATDTGADDAAVWKMYKSKKEKKADLHESNDYHKRDTVKTRTLAPTLAPTMPSKGKQKSGTTPKNTSSTTPCPPPKAPPLQLKLDTTVRKQVAKEEATEDWPPPLASPPQILIALPEQPKAPTLRDLEISVDQEIEGEKQRLRRWLYRLQTWLWTFNEGVGLNFVEITDTPDWDTGFSDSVSSTHGGDEGQTEYARSGPCVAGCGSLGGSQNGMGQPRRVHRGGSRNKHTLWKMEVREREMMERETNEKELKEMEVRERAREMGVWCTGGGRSQPGLGPWMSGALIDDGERRGRSLEIAMPSW
ncbi:hypothetical protein BGX38DRAFT_1146697 [Terfezia claveryi]|nr:hypothetical protein BGX38DRAFT_1146697 [Terfezia claveryi]